MFYVAGCLSPHYILSEFYQLISGHTFGVAKRLGRIDFEIDGQLIRCFRTQIELHFQWNELRDVPHIWLPHCNQYVTYTMDNIGRSHENGPFNLH